MAKRKDKPAPKIVSSAHLAGNRVAELSEFEFALTPIFHAYGRWIVRCTAAAGQGDLSPLDVLILHHTNHRDRAKTLADLALVLNVEDDHVVNYGLKKLKRLGLVAGVKQGKEVHWAATQKAAPCATAIARSARPAWSTPWRASANRMTRSPRSPR